MYKRWNIRRIILWIFLIMQIILVVIYLTTQNESTTNVIQPNLKNSISFISTNKNITKYEQSYYNENNKVVLSTKYAEQVFADFNSSVCYKNGTDLKSMKRQKIINWKCICLPGWHGNDCGQPEVIWRALLATKKPQQIIGPRKIQRRLIYFSEIDIISSEFIEISINELKDVADLFILFDYNAEFNIKSKLNSGFLKNIFNKILYVTGANKHIAWKKAKHVIRNLREDDIFFISNPFEIPNVKALNFLKLYSDWPQPLTFRLRWSVYGFFWKHPQKTILSTGACTISYLYDALDDNIDNLNFKFISSDNLKDKQGFIVGDLNHFGGWFCEFCNEPALILSSLKFVNNSSIIEKLANKKMDVTYLEDLIENGIYLDGTTELVRAHRSNENYYAPSFVNDNSWKYDWLLINLYSKLDYY